MAGPPTPFETRVLMDGGRLAVRPGVIGGGSGAADFQILLVHFLVHNGVPGVLALLTGDVIFPGPAPQAQLFDKIQLRHYATCHNTFPSQRWNHSDPIGWSY